MSADRVLPGPVCELSAAVRVPTSKSLTNRALVAAAAAGGGTISSPLDSDDTRHLAEVLALSGWETSWEREILIGARVPVAGTTAVDLRDSGTGVRFALALLAAVPGRWVIDGSPRLRERPMAPLLEALAGLGVRFEATEGGLPVVVEGARLAGGRVEIRPEVSSQFVSALLMAAPLMTGPLELSVVGPTPSRPYLDLTEDVLRAFGARVERDRTAGSWTVSRGSMAPTRYEVEGDWSAAAFFLAAAAVAGGAVRVGPLREDSRQGDRMMAEVLGAAGGTVEPLADGVVVRGPIRAPVDADLVDAPDLFPALAVVAATIPGSRIRGVEHLRHKESDRLALMLDNLARVGARARVDGAELVFDTPLGRAAGPVGVTAGGDHRIAMAMAVASLVAGPLRLDDPSVVSKSFPGFWREWSRLVAAAHGQETSPP